ncbi:hypothetical protein J6590_031450 [Homalodisca vitripennis]|nr:hypothetical protein J6590_031450 [Homalodisca vitripennis]
MRLKMVAYGARHRLTVWLGGCDVERVGGGWETTPSFPPLHVITSLPPSLPTVRRCRIHNHRPTLHQHSLGFPTGLWESGTIEGGGGRGEISESAQS